MENKMKINGKEFPYRLVYDRELKENVIVADDNLLEELVDENGCYKSKEAKRIDERIAFYAPKEAIETKDDEQLEAYYNFQVIS